MKVLLIGVMLLLIGCSVIPDSIDGMIVTKPNGQLMKIEWDEGRGNSYLFYDQITVINHGDTTKEWRLITQ